MEFDLNTFTIRLRELMYPLFPYEGEALKEMKHKNRPSHIRDVAFMNNPIIYGLNQNSFDIGNENAEKNYPYYHILEDAPVIRKKGKGTTKTKGSQANVEVLKDRDYGKVSVKYTGDKYRYSKEYSKNVRGSRNRLNSISHYYTDYNGQKVLINRESNSYQNIHYHYIEKILNSGILDTLAVDFNMKRKRTENTGLEEEWLMQENTTDNNLDNLLTNMLNSF